MRTLTINLVIPLVLMAALRPIPARAARHAAPAAEPGARDVLAVLAAGIAPAAPAERGPQVYKLTVRPRATTRPALRHRLLPDVGEETPGNAAQIYLLSFIQASAFPQSVRDMPPIGAEEAARYGIKPDALYPGYDRLTLYQEASLEKLPQQEVEQFLSGYEPAFQSLGRAARREHCRWELPLREQGFGVVLPHLNPARDLTNLKAVRARLQMARKDYAGALSSLQNTFELARDLNDQALLLQALVGVGIAAKSLDVTAELMQQPEGPNLYWALAALPKPYLDMRASLRLERASLLYSFPNLRRVQADNLTVAEWQAMFTHVSQVMGARGPSPSDKLESALLGVTLYPRAKRWLAEQGVGAREVEAMSVPSVLARYQYGSYEQWYDEVLKLTGLPYWQAHEGLRRVEQRVADERLSSPLLAIIPTVQRAYFQGVKLDRLIAALQAVEALRNYAAAHGGSPPARLDELSETPAPTDPSTGKPFVYQVQGDRVTLESPAPPGDPPAEGLRVEVTFAK